MMKTMSNQVPALSELFQKQLEFQQLIKQDKFEGYVDDPEEMSKSILGLIGESGEVLQADQRWKSNGRNTYFDREEKIAEIADCFIFLLNVCIYSDVTAFDIANAVDDKININRKRYNMVDTDKYLKK